MTGTLVRIGRAAVAAVVLLSLPRVVHAQDSTAKAAPLVYKNHLYDKLQLSADLTTVLNTSDVRVDGDNLGTTINFRETFGMSATNVQPRIGARWKPGRRTEFEVGYQWIGNKGQRTLTDTIYVGNDTIFGGADVKTSLRAPNAVLQFRYSILATERHNIGVAIGFGGVFYDFQIDATAGGCVGEICDSTGGSIQKKVTLPTGDIGVFGRWRLGDKWYVGGDARYLAGKVDRYSADVFEGDLLGAYFLSDKWGIQGGFNYTAVGIDVAPNSSGTGPKDQLQGTINYNYTSLRLGVILAL